MNLYDVDRCLAFSGQHNAAVWATCTNEKATGLFRIIDDQAFLYRRLRTVEQFVIANIPGNHHEGPSSVRWLL